MELHIRKFEKKDETEIQSALKSISGMDKEQWKWKFFGNPEAISKIWVIEDNGTIAGHMALQGINLNIGSETIQGCQAVDLFIKEDYRRKGLFVKLGQNALEKSGQEGMKAAIGFPNHEALGGHLKYDWKEIGMISRGLKPLDIDKYSKSLKTSPQLSKMFLKIKSRENAMPDNSLKATQITAFGENISEFSKVALEGKNAVFRTAAHLNWRYCQAPHRKYVKFLAVDGDEISGYIIGYESTREPGHGYIADILVNPGNIICARALIKTLENHFVSKGIFAVHSWIPNSEEYQQAFHDAGYIPREPTQPFIVRVNGDFEGMDKIFNFDKWFITMGDSDLH